MVFFIASDISQPVGVLFYVELVLAQYHHRKLPRLPIRSIPAPMDSTIVTQLPILNAGQVTQLEPDGKALLSSDLCCLYMTIDGQIVDMVLYSNVGKAEV